MSLASVARPTGPFSKHQQRQVEDFFRYTTAGESDCVSTAIDILSGPNAVVDLAFRTTTKFSTVVIINGLKNYA